MSGIQHMLVGSTPRRTLTMAPASQTNGGSTASFTFAPETVTPGGGAVVSYAWDFINVVGSGNFVITAGGGNTASATPSAQLVNPASNLQGDIRCTANIGGTIVVATAHLSYTRS